MTSQSKSSLKRELRASPSERPMKARGRPSRTYTGRRVHNISQHSRFLARVRFMLGEGPNDAGTFVYYPEEDRFEEIVSAQSGRYSPTGQPRIIPCLTVFGREVYEMPEHHWRLFLHGHPGAVARYSAEFNEPSEALLDIDAFAATRQDNVPH